MTMIDPKYKAMIDIESEVAGKILLNWTRNTVIESRMVTPRCNFSPDSGGDEKLNNVIDDNIIQGIIKLKP